MYYGYDCNNYKMLTGRFYLYSEPLDTNIMC